MPLYGKSSELSVVKGLAAYSVSLLDCSSDSETDSEIRTEREKDIELASSHSSDEDDAITPAARHTLPANGNFLYTLLPGLADLLVCHFLSFSMPW